MSSRVALPDLKTASSLLNVSFPSGTSGWGGVTSRTKSASRCDSILLPSNAPPVIELVHGIPYTNTIVAHGIQNGLALLLERLAQIETAQEKWIRFLYAYPNKITQKLLDTIAQYPSLVKYIDMPLQHASAQVLKRMKRGASGDIFLKLLERIRRTIPGVAIRTSMMVLPDPNVEHPIILTQERVGGVGIQPSLRLRRTGEGMSEDRGCRQ